jgi:hypothetical protein
VPVVLGDSGTFMVSSGLRAILRATWNNYVSDIRLRVRVRRRLRLCMGAVLVACVCAVGYNILTSMESASTRSWLLNLWTAVHAWEWASALPALVGSLTGGLLSFCVALYTLSSNRRTAIEAARREHERSAARELRRTVRELNDAISRAEPARASTARLYQRHELKLADAVGSLEDTTLSRWANLTKRAIELYVRHHDGLAPLQPPPDKASFGRLLDGTIAACDLFLRGEFELPAPRFPLWLALPLNASHGGKDEMYVDSPREVELQRRMNELLAEADDRAAMIDGVRQELESVRSSVNGTLRPLLVAPLTELPGAVKVAMSSAGFTVIEEPGGEAINGVRLMTLTDSSRPDWRVQVLAQEYYDGCDGPEHNFNDLRFFFRRQKNSFETWLLIRTAELEQETINTLRSLLVRVEHLRVLSVEVVFELLSAAELTEERKKEVRQLMAQSTYDLR